MTRTTEGRKIQEKLILAFLVSKAIEEVSTEDISSELKSLIKRHTESLLYEFMGLYPGDSQKDMELFRKSVVDAASRLWERTKTQKNET